MRSWQMKEYPQLEPISLRDEAQPGYEKIAWKPTWRCFCCHDTGFVQYSLVKKVIKNYIPDRHKPIECNATFCNISLGDILYETETLDCRFSTELCDRLDSDERQMWQEWSRERHQRRMLRLELINDSKITNNLRVRSRTTAEQLEINRRHQNVRSNY